MKRNAQSSVFVLWTGGILVCLLAVLLTLILSSCGSGDNVPITTDPPAQTTAPADDGSQTTIEPGAMTGTPTDSGAQPTAAPTVLGETADAGQEYIDKLTFLGDSTTYGLWYYNVLTGGRETNQVWTPASGTLALFNYATATIEYPRPESGNEISIQEAARQGQPEYLVITLGVNGVSSMDEESFKECYTNLINNILAVSPNTKIICNSIYPNMTSYQYYDSINNENITRANGWIQEIASATGTRYADSCSVLKDANGALRAEYCNGDGIHLNADGFNAVLNYLRTHAYQ